MNWNPTAYPGGTSLKPLKIDLIWVLTEHTIKDLLASLTILYCVGRDLMAAPFSSANFGSGCLKMICFYFPGLRCFCPRIWGLGCFEDDVFSLSGAAPLPLNLQVAGATGFFPHIIRLGRPICMFSVFWEEGGEFGRKGRASRQKRRDSNSFEAM